MKIEPIEFGGWREAYRCTVGAMELIVVTSMGPRILSLCFDGGENLLYEDHTDFKVGTWRLFGGHRLTVAPESDASYAPDNDPCQVIIKSGQLLIRQQFDDGLQRCIEICSAPDGAAFQIHHMLRNTGLALWHGAAWAITCVRPDGRVILPKTGNQVRFWAPPHQNYADASSAQWWSAGGHFVVEPNGERGKIGTGSQGGWLALVRPDISFIIRSPTPLAGAAYPDDGCNVEVYSCADYLELETLSPLTFLHPGQELSHLEWWQVVPSESWNFLRLGQKRGAQQSAPGGGR